jgi:hypothetical protein
VSLDIDSDDIFVTRCVDVVKCLCTDPRITEDVRVELEKLKPLSCIDDVRSALHGIQVPAGAISVVLEMIKSRVCSLRLLETTTHLRKETADIKSALSGKKRKLEAMYLDNEHLIHRFGGWLSACSSWTGDVRIPILALEDVAERPTLKVTSAKMGATVKRAMISGGTLNEKTATRTPGPDAIDCINVHIAYFKRTSKGCDDSDTINKLLYYVRVSRILRRKCRLFVLPSRAIFDRFAEYALMYEEYDFSVMELVPFETPPVGRSGTWSTVAVKFFWSIAATFVRPGPNGLSTGSLFSLIDQLEVLEGEHMIHTDLTRSTIKFDTTSEKFYICGLDRIQKAKRGSGGDNARQFARVIKTILEYLIRMFFENAKTMGSIDKENCLATQWGASLAAWGILRTGLHDAQKSNNSLWKDSRQLRHWIHDQLERVSNQNGWGYGCIRDMYARTAISYDRKR